VIYILGDRDDNIVKFSAQRSFAIEARNAGHRVVVIPTNSPGNMNHSTSLLAIAAAAACAKGLPPDGIRDTSNS
jgi:hypothetical protein